MILDSLAMLDFRAFSGLHHFDLTPKLKRGKPAPIVLFGGLNGGGKTTTLNALKLALYGKGVIGSTASVVDYHQYLRECIHRSPKQTVQPRRASVELTFRYAQHGVVSTYHIKRDWTVEAGDKVREGLLVSRDSQDLTELSYDQAQAFLNELIPIGVSELFFFDGEKIATLAEETSGETLRQSINKLLGLDVIDRLDSDLAVLIRTRAERLISAERKAKISESEQEYTTLCDKLEQKKSLLIQYRTEIGEAERNIAQFDSQINARGGAWSSSKQDEAAKLEQLVARKELIISELQSLAANLLPLAIPSRLIANSLTQIGDEQVSRAAGSIAELLKKKESSFLAAIKKAVPIKSDHLEAVRLVYLRTFKDAIKAGEDSITKIHDVSDSRAASIEHRLHHVLKADKWRADKLLSELENVDQSIDAIGLNIARAPDESLLLPLIREQAIHQERLGGLKAQKVMASDEIKELLNRLFQVARSLEGLHAEATKYAERNQVFRLAAQTRELLTEFSTRARDTKLKELEVQFYESFNRLARKEDRHLAIRIDSTTFEVALVDESGEVIQKKELSAGEKQIYAISILEALARTSGRSLPVIIDTPLGRLDSIHRQKLVANYFPKTSHQILILSTDTEIDRSFYEELRPHISHAYHLIYSPETRSTVVDEGYFWRHAERV